MLELSTAEEVKDALKGIPQDSILFFDVDDTLITPVSKTFRARPTNQLITEIKENHTAYPNYEALVSRWRLQRKMMLLDQRWPEIIYQLKQTYQVFGLTSIQTGSFGDIDCMESWRFKELESLGITFSHAPSLYQQEESDTKREKNQPVFYQGIFLTGNASKDQVLEKYQPILLAPFIVMIDDRLQSLKDVQAFCDKSSIGFLGIHFNGLAQLPDKPDLEIARIQRDHLLAHGQWLEDDQALNKIHLSKET